VVKLKNPQDLEVSPGGPVKLSAEGTYDPDGDELTFHWWQYREADTYSGSVVIKSPGSRYGSFTLPGDALPGETIHIICEVKDIGTPQLTEYGRIIITAKP
jgi:hypothetical protein